MWLLDTSPASQPSSDVWARGDLCTGRSGAGGHIQAPCLQSWEQEGDLREAKSKGRKLSSLWAMYAPPLTEALKYECVFQLANFTFKKKFPLEDLATLADYCTLSFLNWMPPYSYLPSL